MILEARRYVDASYEVDAIAETHEVHLFVGSRRVATSKRPGLGTSGTTTETADAVEYYHPDHVGSNTLVTNAAGEVVQETVTTPFGELHAIVDGAGNAVSPQGSTTRYLFTDQEHDAESGLHYFGARFQDPWTGRFLSQDLELIGASAGSTFGRIEGDGQNLNAYAYVLSRPTTLVDPSGRFFTPGPTGETQYRPFQLPSHSFSMEGEGTGSESELGAGDFLDWTQTGLDVLSQNRDVVAADQPGRIPSHSGVGHFLFGGSESAAEAFADQFQ